MEWAKHHPLCCEWGEGGVFGEASAQIPLLQTRFQIYSFVCVIQCLTRPVHSVCCCWVHDYTHTIMHIVVRFIINNDCISMDLHPHSYWVCSSVCFVGLPNTRRGVWIINVIVCFYCWGGREGGCVRSHYNTLAIGFSGNHEFEHDGLEGR